MYRLWLFGFRLAAIMWFFFIVFTLVLVKWANRPDLVPFLWTIVLFFFIMTAICAVCYSATAPAFVRRPRTPSRLP